MGHLPAPDEWLPFVTESITDSIDRIESKGRYAASRVKNSNQWTTGRVGGGGSIGLELQHLGLRTILQHAFGVESGAGPYTYDIGDLEGLGLSMEIFKPASSSTPGSMVYQAEGGKITSWQMRGQVGEIATLGLDLDFEEISRAASVGSAPTYPSSPDFFTFEGGVTWNGAQLNAKSVTISGNNGLKTDRYFLGNNNRKLEQLEANPRVYNVSVDMEFDNDAILDDYDSGTERALVVTFSGPGTGSLVVTTNARVESEPTPTIGGDGMLEGTVNFMVLASDPADDSTAIDAVYTVA